MRKRSIAQVRARQRAVQISKAKESAEGFLMAAHCVEGMLTRLGMDIVMAPDPSAREMIRQVVAPAVRRELIRTMSGYPYQPRFGN